MATTEQLIHDELERQKTERIREGWKEFRKENPEMFKSQTKLFELHVNSDKQTGKK